MYGRLITVLYQSKEVSHSVKSADTIQAQESDSTDSYIRDVASAPNKLCLTNIAGCFLSERCYILFSHAAANACTSCRGAVLFTKARWSTQV